MQPTDGMNYPRRLSASFHATVTDHMQNTFELSEEVGLLYLSIILKNTSVYEIFKILINLNYSILSTTDRTVRVKLRRC